MPPSKAQRWARERNWYKAQIKNMKGTLTKFQSFATEDESIQVNITVSHIDKLLNSYKENNELSKTIYLARYK